MNHKMFKPIIGVAVMSVVAPPLHANAAVEEMTDTVSLKNVEVYGNAFTPLQEKKVGLLEVDVPLKFLPMTVTRLEGATLERKHIVDMADAVRFLPGVVMSSNQLGQFQRFSIRGTNDIAIAYDGIRDERANLTTIPFGDLSDVESIEVLKGPGAVLMGYAVMGGIINIQRKKPTDQFSAHGSIHYGSWKQKDASFAFSGKLFGPLRYRAQAFTSNGDGYRKVNANRLSGVFALNADIGKHGFWEAQINGADDSYTTDIGGAPTMPADIYYTGTDNLYLPAGARNPLCDYEDVYNDLANNRMRRRLFEVSTTYTHTFSEALKLRERFHYTHSNLDYCCVEGMTYVTSTTPDGYKYQYTSRGKTYYTNLDEMRSGTPLNFNPDHKTIGNTLELTGKITTGFINHNYTAGWNFSYFNFTQYNGYNSDDVWGPGVGEIISVSDPHYVRDWWDCKISAANITRYTNNGIYLRDAMDFGDHWKGMISLRYDDYSYRRATATVTDGTQHYDKANRTPWSKVKTTAFTYQGGVVYLPIPSVSIFASVSSFFKPYNTFYNANYIYYDRNGKEFIPSMDGGEVYRPETGHQFELGARYENKWFDVNASVYLINRRNVVTNIGKMPVEENGEQVEKTVQAQVGKYDSRGFDIDVEFHPWSTLNIAAGLGWADYRRRASNMDWAEGLPWVTLDESGQINLRATNVPRTTYYVMADYTVPSGVLRSLSVHLSGNFTDRIYTNVTNNTYDPSRFIVDGGLYYTVKEHVTLSLLVNNIFNNHFFTSSTRLGKPRNFMAGVSYKF